MKPVKNENVTNFHIGDFIAYRHWAGSTYERYHRYVIVGLEWCAKDWRTGQPVMTSACPQCTTGNLAYTCRRFNKRKGAYDYKICAGSVTPSEYVQVPDPRPPRPVRTRRRRTHETNQE